MTTTYSTVRLVMEILSTERKLPHASGAATPLVRDRLSQAMPNIELIEMDQPYITAAGVKYTQSKLGQMVMGVRASMLRSGYEIDGNLLVPSAEMQAQEVDDTLANQTQPATESDASLEGCGWIYAYDFPDSPHILKIGKTVVDVEARLKAQINESSLHAPRLQKKWFVSSVKEVEVALHATLKVWGFWRYYGAGREFFEVNIDVIDAEINRLGVKP